MGIVAEGGQANRDAAVSDGQRHAKGRRFSVTSFDPTDPAPGARSNAARTAGAPGVSDDAANATLLEMQAHWTTIAAGLRRDLGVRTFDHWLKPLEPGAFCAATGTLTLNAPSAFAASWITERFADRLTLAWRHHVPAVRTVRVAGAARRTAVSAVSGAGASAGAPSTFGAVGSTPASATPTVHAPNHGAANQSVPAQSAFDPRLCFDRFITARSNILASSAARRMANPETPPFSPLYLRSGTGQGKTHLLHAIGQAYEAAVPGARALLLSAERFMREFVATIRGGDSAAFKDRLRSVDLLLIDDLQFVIGKGSTQQELLHTLDDLMAAGKRIVVAADRAPHALDGIDPRLLSRLSGGLDADIEAPEAGLREAVLRQRIADMPGIVVPEDVIVYLAAHVTRNIRELEGALNRLVAYAALTGETITLALAATRLADAVKSSARRVTIDEIQRAVCAHYRLEKSDMASKRRLRAIARPRQIAMFLAKELTPRSYPEIGRRFGGRDHSTVIHAVRTIEQLRATDSEMDAAIASIRHSLVG